MIDRADDRAIRYILDNRSIDPERDITQDQWARAVDVVTEYLRVDNEARKLRLRMIQKMPDDYLWPVMKSHWIYKLKSKDSSDFSLDQRAELHALDQELVHFLARGYHHAPPAALAQVKEYLESKQD